MFTKGQIVRIKRGKVAKRAYVLATFEAIGKTWVEFAFVTHTESGTIVVGRQHHYEDAARVLVD